ncbi:MAG: DUF222 domain-containing protein [Trebonia sp.]|jgi:hypothetical protein
MGTDDSPGPGPGLGLGLGAGAGPAGPVSTGFASVADALRAGCAMADYLNSPAGRDLDGAACGEALMQIGAIQSALTAAQNALLRRFDADSAHDADGYATTAAWLAARTGLGRKDAKAAVRHMRLLGRHPLLDDAAAGGAVTISWAREMAGWTGKIGDPEMQRDADQILLEAAQAGADLDGLRVIAQAAYEAWRSQHPDDDPPGKGFEDRFVQLDTTMDGAGRLAGNLTPECAAAVNAVLEALGKRRGPEDDRTAAQRFHDALQEGCELLIRAKMVPDRAGSDTRVEVQIPLSALRGMPGAPAVEEAWLRARAGEHGYLTGKDAEAAACDALIVPVVTGAPDWGVIAQMIALLTDRGNRARHCRCGPHPGGVPGPPAGPCQTVHGLCPQSLPPQEQEELLYGLAKLAIDFVSGPGALASALRRTLLGNQLNRRSVLLDIGYSNHIPDSIRRAVIARDKHCAWPGGCDRPAAVSDVHHITHKKDGGPTSVKDCILLCQFHHDICIHRWGWKIELLPDGTVRAAGPQGQVIQNHPPPTTPSG